MSSRQEPAIIATLRPGAAYIPEDFPDRIETLRQWTGLSRLGFAVVIGADARQVKRWGEGGKPSGEVVLSLFRLAMKFPGGVELLGKE